MKGLWCRQVLAIVRLETRKTFLSRRSLWVYLLALAPLLLFTAHSAFVPHHRERLQRIAREHPVSAEALGSIQEGMTATRSWRGSAGPITSGKGTTRTIGIREAAGPTPDTPTAARISTSCSTTRPWS